MRLLAAVAITTALVAATSRPVPVPPRDVTPNGGVSIHLIPLPAPIEPERKCTATERAQCEAACAKGGLIVWICDVSTDERTKQLTMTCACAMPPWKNVVEGPTCPVEAS